MDLQMKKIESDRPGLNQTVLPSGSEEALYRVDFRNAESHSYIPLTRLSLARALIAVGAV